MGTDWEYEPAADLGMTAGEAVRDVVREPGLVGGATARAWWVLAHAWLKWRHRLRIEGRERLPDRAPFVMVANHTSHLDALALGAAAPRRLRRLVFPIAAGDTFFRTPATAAFAAFALNALPMWRDNCGLYALKALRERLLKGRGVLVLFPEGTRSRTGSMAPFKPGAGMLVAGTTVPVFPCGIFGAFEAWPPQSPRPGKGPIRVRIGSALTFADVKNRRAGWSEVATRLEEAVRAIVSDDEPASM